MLSNERLQEYVVADDSMRLGAGTQREHKHQGEKKIPPHDKNHRSRMRPHHVVLRKVCWVLGQEICLGGGGSGVSAKVSLAIGMKPGNVSLETIVALILGGAGRAIKIRLHDVSSDCNGWHTSSDKDG